ncbi:hypothetical protein ACIP27_08020, partial [Streptomyces hydrogenans]|uniref:hypothetical protein n=1 Tax=Streptomyces hydrogenans TaxID=1873719 RepID=UPI00380DECAB
MSSRRARRRSCAEEVVRAASLQHGVTVRGSDPPILTAAKPAPAGAAYCCSFPSASAATRTASSHAWPPHHRGLGAVSLPADARRGRLHRRERPRIRIVATLSEAVRRPGPTAGTRRAP